MSIYVALSSNLDDPLERVREGFDALANHPRMHLVRQSSIYRTKPWGYTEQPDFYNAVCEVETDLQPRELLAALRQLEMDLGRKPSPVRWGPRRMDFDLLLYHDEQFTESELSVPHPRMRQRAFVLVPLLEISPELNDPVSGASYAEDLARIARQPDDVILVER